MASQWCKNCNEEMSLIFYSGEMEHYQCPYCKQFITVKTIGEITHTKPDNEDVSKLCGDNIMVCMDKTCKTKEFKYDLTTHEFICVGCGNRFSITY